GSTCTGGTCVCAPTQTQCPGGCSEIISDPNNCGACGNPCPANKVCSLGACKDSCDSGLDDCNRACVPFATSDLNCGACGNRCSGTSHCSGGNCVCPMAQTLCGDTCVDLESDPNNCGMCSVACAEAQACGADTCGPKCPDGQVRCADHCVNPTN